MGTAKRMALIVAGYVLSVVGGFAAVALNELRMPADVAEGSPGMVAFGDVILFLVVTGFLALVPTCFLLKLCADRAPRVLLAIVLVIAAMGPVSWLAMVWMAASGPSGGPSLANWPQALAQVFGLFIATVAIPRMVSGPVMVVVEAMVFFLLRDRVARSLLAAAMLLDIVPIGLFVVHMARSVRY